MAAAGLYSETDWGRTHELLGFSLSGRTVRQFGACLVFPYLDAAGRPMTFPDRDGKDRPFVRLKPTRPRADAKKKERKVKYESPAGAPCRPYFPPGTRSALADTSVVLLITEGEKKSLAADQAGFPCIGWAGSGRGN
jgi:hypothetical protein